VCPLNPNKKLKIPKTNENDSSNLEKPSNKKQVPEEKKKGKKPPKET